MNNSNQNLIKVLKRAQSFANYYDRNMILVHDLNYEYSIHTLEEIEAYHERETLPRHKLTIAATVTPQQANAYESFPELAIAILEDIITDNKHFHITDLKDVEQAIAAVEKLSHLEIGEHTDYHPSDLVQEVKEILASVKNLHDIE